jgi:hypothetical protein
MTIAWQTPASAPAILPIAAGPRKGRRDVPGRLDHIEQVVRHAFAFFPAGLGGADLELAIHGN